MFLRQAAEDSGPQEFLPGRFWRQASYVGLNLRIAGHHQPQWVKAIVDGEELLRTKRLSPLQHVLPVLHPRFAALSSTLARTAASVRAGEASSMKR